MATSAKDILRSVTKIHGFHSPRGATPSVGTQPAFTPRGAAPAFVSDRAKTLTPR
jgi:hypothetical protein